MIPSQLPPHDPTAVMGRRIGAFVVDGLLITVPVALIASRDVEYYGAGMLENAGLTPERACEIHRERFDEPCAVVGDTAYFVDTPVSPIALVTGLGLILLLLVVVQGLAGLTPGKALFGLRTVRRDGRPPGVGRALVRWLLWIVDGAPWCFPLVGLIAGLSSPGHRRVGDMAADTLVVGKGDAGRPVTVPGLADGGHLPTGGHGAPGVPYAPPGEPAYAIHPPATPGAAMPRPLAGGTLALPAGTPALPDGRSTDGPLALPAGRSTDSLPALPAGRSTDSSPAPPTSIILPTPVTRPAVDVPPGPDARTVADSGVDGPGTLRTPAEIVGDGGRRGGDGSGEHPVAPSEHRVHTDTHGDDVAATGIQAPDGGAARPADDPAEDDPPDRLVHHGSHVDDGSARATDPEDHERTDVAASVAEGPDPAVAVPVEGQPSGPTTADPGPDATAVMSAAPDPEATTVMSTATPAPDDTAVLPAGQWDAPAVPPGTGDAPRPAGPDAPPADAPPVGAPPVGAPGVGAPAAEAEPAEPGGAPGAVGTPGRTGAVGPREAAHPYPPQWDPARGTYIVWEPVRGQWLGWDNTAKEWHPL